MAHDRGPTVWGLIRSAADEHPDRVIVSDRSGRELTTAGLVGAAESVAAGLGVAPGEVVSWQLPNGLDAVVVLAALARVGAVQNPVIPILRSRDVSIITGQVGSEIMVVPEEWRGFGYGDMARQVAAGTGARVVALGTGSCGDGALELPEGDPGQLPPPPTDPLACRWLYFTSGTVGRPKGARHTDRSLIASSDSMVERLGIAEGDVYPIAWPITHIGGIAMLSAVLRAGGRLVLFDSFDPGTFGDEVARSGATIIGSGVPFFRAVLDAQRRHGRGPLYPELRACTAGGAPTPPEIIQQLADTLGVPGVVNSWGLTEFPIASCPAAGDPPAKLARTVGRPSSGVEIRIVEGELRLKGPQCFLGYADPAMDGDAFDDEGWFRTGDLGQIDPDGFVEITGRLKEVIIRNGENVSPAEIEEILLRHPGVADVAVIGLPDTRTGERVCAVVVAEAGHAPSLEDLRAHCEQIGLARQKAPEQVELVETLGRNPMGKVVKTQLRELVLRKP